MDDSKLKFNKAIIPKTQNEINKSIVLNFLIEKNITSRSQIVKALHISAPTVSKIVDDLINDGFVVENGKIESTGGKRPTEIIFNSEFGSVIGVDLAKEEIKIARSDFKGNILEKHTGFKIFDHDKKLLDKVIKEIQVFINNAITNKKNCSKKLPIKALCLAVPAIIDIEKAVVKGASLFEGWEGLELGEVLKKQFDFPIYVENSTNISALGEKFFGVGKPYNETAYLEVSEGIGATIIINNKIYRGHNNASGEVGYILGNIKNLYNKYTNKGYMEYEASFENMELEVVNAIKNGEKTILKDIISNDFTKINSSFICKAASLNDKLAVNAVKKVVENLALIVTDLILILNPEILIIGGNISELPDVNELFIEPIKNIVKGIIPFELPEIRLSQLGKEAGIIGSTFYAIDNELTKMFPYKL